MKNRMKRLAALSMAVLMAASMAACGGSGGGSSDGGSSSGGSSSGDDKEIVYWNIGTESPDKDIVTAAVEKFNSETESGYTHVFRNSYTKPIRHNSHPKSDAILESRHPTVPLSR